MAARRRTVVSKLPVGTIGDRRNRIAAFGPFTSDNQADVVLRHSDTGVLELWESSGTQLAAPPSPRCRAAAGRYRRRRGCGLRGRDRTLGDVAVAVMPSFFQFVSVLVDRVFPLFG
jgi:hypothetical protein